MFDADFIQREVDCPSNNWCSSGHIAPDLYRRNGPDSSQETIRFFQVSGKNIEGIYCEICLVIAHWMAKKKRLLYERKICRTERIF